MRLRNRHLSVFILFIGLVCLSSSKAQAQTAFVGSVVYEKESPSDSSPDSDVTLQIDSNGKDFKWTERVGDNERTILYLASTGKSIVLIELLGLKLAMADDPLQKDYFEKMSEGSKAGKHLGMKTKTIAGKEASIRIFSELSINYPQLREFSFLPVHFQPFSEHGNSAGYIAQEIVLKTFPDSHFSVPKTHTFVTQEELQLLFPTAGHQ